MHLWLRLYRVSKIRWFYGISPKLAKIERCGFRKLVFDFSETNDGAIAPSTVALVSGLQGDFENWEPFSNFLKKKKFGYP